MYTIYKTIYTFYTVKKRKKEEMYMDIFSSYSNNSDFNIVLYMEKKL